LTLYQKEKPGIFILDFSLQKLPQLDAFRTANWKRIQWELEMNGILGQFENNLLQN